MSARDYVRGASKVCAHARARGHHVELPRSTAGPASIRAAARAASRAAARYTHTSEGLVDLRPPKRLARFDTKWVALVRQTEAELTEQADAVRLLTARAMTLGRERGITACPTPIASDEELTPTQDS
jgi:hypothetical protein